MFIFYPYKKIYFSYQVLSRKDKTTYKHAGLLFVMLLFSNHDYWEWRQSKILFMYQGLRAIILIVSLLRELLFNQVHSTDKFNYINTATSLLVLIWLCLAFISDYMSMWEKCFVLAWLCVRTTNRQKWKQDLPKILKTLWVW